MKGAKFSKLESTTAIQSPSNLIRFSATSVSLNQTIWSYKIQVGEKASLTHTKLQCLKGVKFDHDFFWLCRFLGVQLNFSLYVSILFSELLHKMQSSPGRKTYIFQS